MDAEKLLGSQGERLYGPCVSLLQRVQRLPKNSRDFFFFFFGSAGATKRSRLFLLNKAAKEQEASGAVPLTLVQRHAKQE